MCDISIQHSGSFSGGAIIKSLPGTQEDPIIAKLIWKRIIAGNGFTPIISNYVQLCILWYMTCITGKSALEVEKKHPGDIEESSQHHCRHDQHHTGQGHKVCSYSIMAMLLEVVIPWLCSHEPVSGRFPLDDIFQKSYLRPVAH